MAVVSSPWVNGACFSIVCQETPPFQGTAAWWLAPGDKLNQNDAGWILRRGEQQHAFDTATRSFTVNPRLESATGFDTYWYIWSLTNPQTQIAAAAH